MLVVDASGAVQASLTEAGFTLFGDERLVAPTLMWSEASSVIHEMRWRGDISNDLAARAFDVLLAAPITPRYPRRLRREAWETADRLGWAKTYDAEYVALARILRCPLFTVDGRLRRGASHVVPIIGPADLARR